MCGDACHGILHFRQAFVFLPALPSSCFGAGVDLCRRGWQGGGMVEFWEGEEAASLHPTSMEGLPSPPPPALQTPCHRTHEKALHPHALQHKNGTLGRRGQEQKEEERGTPGRTWGLSQATAMPPMRACLAAGEHTHLNLFLINIFGEETPSCRLFLFTTHFFLPAFPHPAWHRQHALHVCMASSPISSLMEKEGSNPHLSHPSRKETHAPTAHLPATPATILKTLSLSPSLAGKEERD